MKKKPSWELSKKASRSAGVLNCAVSAEGGTVESPGSEDVEGGPGGAGAPPREGEGAVGGGGRRGGKMPSRRQDWCAPPPPPYLFRVYRGGPSGAALRVGEG